MIKQMQWLSHMLLCTFCLALLMFLGGCTDQSKSAESPSAETENEAIEEPQATESSAATATKENSVVADSKETTSMTLDQILADKQHSLFVQRDEKFYPLSTDTYKMAALLVGDNENSTRLTPVINISKGERIATTSIWPSKSSASGEEIQIFPIIGEKYTEGVMPSNWTSCDEINGIELSSLGDGSSIDNLRNYLATIGIDMGNGNPLSTALYCDHPTEFTIGSYEGAKFVETVIKIDQFGLESDFENPISLSLEKTKEGYFYIDLADLAPGKYAMYNEGSKRSEVYKISVFEVE